MFKYLAGAAIGAVAVYGALEFRVNSKAGPEFKVWVDQPFLVGGSLFFDRRTVVLNVQSLEEKPVSVQRVLTNDDPKCVSMDQAQSFEQPMTIGQTLKYGLGVPGAACDPVKVVITTDRGEATYHFNE